MAYQQTLKNGTVLIEEFQILGHLGSGGFANTYLANDLTLGREVAIKEYFPSELAVRHESERVEVKSAAHGAQFEWALGRFVREAKTLAKFRHPSVVRVFRVFNANDTAYIVLEFVRGSNMEAWLKGLGRQPTQSELDELLPPLLDALEVVHSAGILHRDIKPANIYIRAADHTPVLLDFGAARYAAGDYAGTTAAIVSKGYSPHEAYATDSRLQGPWTDIYGLAATIYRALSGSAPPESTMRVLEDHCVAAVDLDLPASGGYRREFLAAIDWALEVMPKQRPQSVADWRYRLLPNTTALPRLRDANGEPTTIQEWNPISDRQSDATTFDPPQPKSDGRVSAAHSASGGSVAPGSARRSTGSQRPDRGATRPSVIVGVSNSVSGTVKPRSTGSVAASGSTSGTASQQHPRPGVVSRPSQPVGNRTFMIGLALFAAGGVALLGQWLVTRKPSTPPQIAAPARPGANDGYLADRNRVEREQAEQKRVADEKARQERAAEQQRLADEKARQERAAEQQRLADEKARQERAAEQQRLADEKARQERAAEQQRLADEKARQERAAEQQRLADEKARQERAAEQQRLADEKARQERAAEQKRLAEEKARQERAAEQQRLAEEKARQERAAEQQRLAEEKARQERAAEQQRLAEEKARQERAAEQQRLAEEKARQERAAEQQRLAEEKARQERAAEQQRLADEKARKDTSGEQQVAANTTEFSTGAGGSRSDREFPLTGSVGEDESSRRTAYLKQIQTVLKSNRCYSGDVTGDPATTRSALELFEKSYQGPMKKIDVASASSKDLESWLGWFWKQESWSCGGRPDVDRQAEERRREREAEQAREQRRREKAAEDAREERRREKAAEDAREERRREREAEAARQARRKERDEPKKVRKVEKPEPKQVYKAPAPVYRAPPRSSGGGGGGGGSDLLRGGR